jgi:transposase-like protein
MHSEPKRKGSLQSVTDGSLTEADARLMFERLRFPDGVHCIFTDCGGAEVYRLTVKASERKDGTYVGPRSLFKCKACRRQFSVTKGTVVEGSKIPLRTWLQVMYRMCSSKKSVSAHQIRREFGLTYEAAWFLCHRIRFAMTDKNPSRLEGIIEADETYIGGKPRGHLTDRIRTHATMSERIKAAWESKEAVFGIRERGGRVRAMAMHKPSQRKIQRTIWENVATSKSRLMTDEHTYYYGIQGVLPHDVIRHKSEYVRGEVHTQGIESFWAILKRGLVGTYHHVDAGYLNQYVQEYAFRHNTRQITDMERFRTLVENAEGRVAWYDGKKARASSSVEAQPQ